ncbi:hypothetical protein [uncultured Cytophaga sp.]|uniref:hypothetical protein n=1 Tax=uncultured Cytophaga sp. TaxID=160238 RepID=UPI00262DEC0B|nr:hypothetical protein [uncultured Cytophaga sp.]
MNALRYISPVLILAFIFVTTVVNAQDFLEDLSLYPDSYINKKIHDNPDINQYYPFIDGRGNYPNLNAKKEFPKTIALISFYIWNDQLIVTNKSVEDFWKETSWIDSVRGNKLASSLNSYSIESIVKRFDSLGTKLITPNDFTDAQKEVYKSLNVTYSKNFRRKSSDSISYELCSAGNYKFIKISNNKLDVNFINSFEEIATLLNVDAVLLIENNVGFDGRLGLINSIRMNLYGFNPMGVDKSNENVKKNKIGYNNFQLYTSIELEIDAIVSQYNEAKELTYENYIGYDRLLDLMIDNMYIAYKKRTEIAPKKI